MTRIKNTTPIASLTDAELLAAAAEAMAQVKAEGAEEPAITDADVTSLEALENDQATPEEPAGQEEAPAEEPVNLMDVVATITDDERLHGAMVIGMELDVRAQFEKTKDIDNDKIHKSLSKSRAKLATPSIAALLIASSVDAAFINRSISAGSRYNVYAIDKLADLVTGMSKGLISNAINIAICRSLFAFRAANQVFDGEMAKAACSKQIRIASPSLAALLIRHTVSPSTAPTQMSSTMNALETLGIVQNNGSQKFPLFSLTDSPQTRRLEEVLDKMAA